MYMHIQHIKQFCFFWCFNRTSFRSTADLSVSWDPDLTQRVQRCFSIKRDIFASNAVFSSGRHKHWQLKHYWGGHERLRSIQSPFFHDMDTAMSESVSLSQSESVSMPTNLACWKSQPRPLWSALHEICHWNVGRGGVTYFYWGIYR